jgi:glycosyltransferase involved in cell wall biosynthesis
MSGLRQEASIPVENHIDGDPAPCTPLRVTKAVVVHGGARDSYQLALALSEAGLLEALVTDLFWPADRSWANRLLKVFPPHLRELVLRRSAYGLQFGDVRLCLTDGLRELLLQKLRRVPFALRRKSTRLADQHLGSAAGKLACDRNAGLVSYSYFGFDAMREYRGAALLFQVHPHPATVRRILREELAAHPDCAASLLQEWELDYQHLVEEPRMASRLLVASSFTKRSLIEHGTPVGDVTVIPYGVDLERFHPSRVIKRNNKVGPLRLLFVGRINQRKGMKYLLEALRLLGPHAVHLTVCGRVVDDLHYLRPFGKQVEVRPSVSERELTEAYQSADLFVFPSVAEGFGQVLLEALACGLPILSTTHTAAPDLIGQGIEGFVVEPRRPDLLAHRIAWAIDHRSELADMGELARKRAEFFTWERFRLKVADAVRVYLATLDEDVRQ